MDGVERISVTFSLWFIYENGKPAGCSPFRAQIFPQIFFAVSGHAGRKHGLVRRKSLSPAWRYTSLA